MGGMKQDHAAHMHYLLINKDKLHRGTSKLLRDMRAGEARDASDISLPTFYTDEEAIRGSSPPLLLREHRKSFPRLFA
jgi:hypothetical protein